MDMTKVRIMVSDTEIAPILREYVFTVVENYGILQKYRSIRLVLRKLRINLSAPTKRSRTIDWKQEYFVVFLTTKH